MIPKCVESSKSERTLAQQLERVAKFADDQLANTVISQKIRYPDALASAAQKRWNRIVRREARKRGLI